MPELWLPIKRKVIREGDREMILIIPQTGDLSYDAYLEEAETEKTKDQLKKKPPKPIATMSKKDVAGALKEYFEWLRRKKSGDIRRFY